MRLGEHAEAAALLRTTLVTMTRTVGVDDPCTLCTENHLAGALNALHEYAEAEALGRGTFEKMRRIFGAGQRDMLIVFSFWRRRSLDKANTLRP